MLGGEGDEMVLGRQDLHVARVAQTAQQKSRDVEFTHLELGNFQRICGGGMREKEGGMRRKEGGSRRKEGERNEEGWRKE